MTPGGPTPAPVAAVTDRRSFGRRSPTAAALVIAALILFFVPLSAPAQTATPVLPGSSPITAPTAAPATTPASTSAPFRLNIGLEGQGQAGEVSVAVQIVIIMTLLSVAPSIVLLMTSFTRIVIVLGFVRTALGTPSAPSNQIVVGLSLFLTFFLMGPVVDRVHNEALRPYLDGKITSIEALDKATVPLKAFMLKQTRTRDIEYFLELGGFPPTAVKDLPMRIVIPAFVVSELQTAFQMGFLLFLPFLVIDFLVSSVLMALGMMMMPPMTVALPLKLLLFVLVDGWQLVVRSLVQSFA
ncbi:MAG: flagellar type III secretion system pore protein FliP [Verrucomicrobia bacterium]|nr:flagellar type III secretion system pore protein FliP [Verrucomicrobiota bacterium]